MNQRYAIGGLMRCCIESLTDAPDDAPDGTVWPCKWCGDTMVVRDGVWHWNRP